MSRIPPLPLLRSFARVARSESFSRAADELNVTQSAVSQHIRQLEEFVGAPLFERTHRKVTLTELGKMYLQLTSGPIALLEEGQATIRAMTTANALLIKSSRTFATHWLAPRMPRLASRHPELNVSLLMLNAIQPMDGHTGDCIIARVERGEARRPGFKVDRLVRSIVTPVCSPKFAKELDMSRLASYPIIHTLMRHNDWHAWCRQAKLPLLPLDHGWTFENSALTYIAAEQGLGIAMAELFMVQHELDEGRLVRISPVEIELERCYYLLTPESRLSKFAARSFREWILDEVGSVA